MDYRLDLTPECTASGNPQPTITWLAPNGEVEKTHYLYTDTNHIITVYASLMHIVYVLLYLHALITSVCVFAIYSDRKGCMLCLICIATCVYVILHTCVSVASGGGR